MSLYSRVANVAPRCTLESVSCSLHVFGGGGAPTPTLPLAARSSEFTRPRLLNAGARDSTYGKTPNVFLYEKPAFSYIESYIVY